MFKRSRHQRYLKAIAQIEKWSKEFEFDYTTSQPKWIVHEQALKLQRGLESGEAFPRCDDIGNLPHKELVDILTGGRETPREQLGRIVPRIIVLDKKGNRISL